MLKLINEVHPNYQLAKQFFKDFKDESLIWTADRWAAKENMSKIGIFNILNERHSFEAIATYLESEFENAKEAVLKNIELKQATTYWEEQAEKYDKKYKYNLVLTLLTFIGGLACGLLIQTRKKNIA